MAMKIKLDECPQVKERNYPYLAWHAGDELILKFVGRDRSNVVFEGNEVSDDESFDVAYKESDCTPLPPGTTITITE